VRLKERRNRERRKGARAFSQERETTISAVRQLAPTGGARQVWSEACAPTPLGTIAIEAILQEVDKMSEDVSNAEGRDLDEPRADPPKGPASVHEQTREKGERARAEREKIEQETTKEQHERNHKEGLEAPPATEPSRTSRVRSRGDPVRG
jgi:hypothetical protein